MGRILATLCNTPTAYCYRCNVNYKFWSLVPRHHISASEHNRYDCPKCCSLVVLDRGLPEGWEQELVRQRYG